MAIADVFVAVFGPKFKAAAQTQMRKLPLVFFILYTIVFLLGALAVAAPFIVKLEWTFQATAMPTVRAGFLFGDQSNANWTFHWNWCTPNSLIDAGACQELRVAWLVASLLWGLHLPLTIAIAVFLFKKPHWVLWVGPLSFIIHIAGGFVYIFRVPPLIRELMQFVGPTVAVQWSLHWAGGVAIASAGVHFLVLLLLSGLHRTFLGLDALPKHGEVSEPTTNQRAPASDDEPSIVTETIANVRSTKQARSTSYKRRSATRDDESSSVVPHSVSINSNADDGSRSRGARRAMEPFEESPTSRNGSVASSSVFPRSRHFEEDSHFRDSRLHTKRRER